MTKCAYDGALHVALMHFLGRFNTPDPSTGSIDPGTPTSWNRYGYVLGDPANHFDRQGLEECGPDEDCCDPDYGCECDPCDPSCGINDAVRDPSRMLMPHAACSSGGGGGAPPPAQPTIPNCSVEVGYVTNVLGSPFSHSFFDVDYFGASEYIEVSPNWSGLLPTMQVNFTSTGIYNDSTQGINF